MAILLQGVPIDNYVGLKVKGARIEGSFTGLEVREYSKVIDDLEKKGVIDHKQATMFKALLTKGCADRVTQIPIRLLLREVLVAYMETPEFQAKLKSPNGEKNPLVRATITLATELAVRDKTTGVSRKPSGGPATATETTGHFPVSQKTANLAWQTYEKTDYDGEEGKKIGDGSDTSCAPRSSEQSFVVAKKDIPADQFDKVKDLFFDPNADQLVFLPELKRETIEKLDIPSDLKNLLLQVYQTVFPDQGTTIEAGGNSTTYGDYVAQENWSPDLSRIELDPRYY